MAYVQSHEDLVSAIKELQRTDPMAKEQWIKYCATRGHGMRDPTKHDVEFLQNFFNTREMIEVQPPGEVGFAELFKEAQKASPSFKQAWSNYRSSMGAKYDDPSKHEESFLAGALEFLGNAACAQMTMGQMCGSMLGKGKGKGGCWGAGTGSWGGKGGGKGDSWGGNGWGGGGGGGGGGGWDSGSTVWGEDVYGPNKRRRTESWNDGGSWNGGGSWKGGGSWNQPTQPTSSAKGGGSWSQPTTSARKQALVDQVKTFQKSGEEQKQAWWAFAGQHGQGKDPARFEEAQLQQFLTMHGWA